MLNNQLVFIKKNFVSKLIMSGSYAAQNSDMIRHKYTIKPESQRALDNSGEFPDCKGLYPDCPETPSLDERMCKTCPKTDGLKKSNSK